MRRREFITLLGGAAASPLATRAQEVNSTKRVAALIGTGEEQFQRRFGPLREGLAQLGWIEPRNVRIEYRWTDNKADLARTYAKEFIDLAPDVIFAAPGPAVEAVQRLTRTIPIVFVTSTDPVRAGYVDSYAHPGGNLTGFTAFEASLDSKYLQLLKDIAPQITRVAVLRSARLAQGRQDVAAMGPAARSFDVATVEVVVDDDPTEIERAIATFAREPKGGLIVPPSNVTQTYHRLIVALAARYALPAVYNTRQFVDAGGLMSYGVNQAEAYRRAASYVDRILRGAKPAELPVQAPTRFEFILNVKTADALGLTVPLSLRGLATDVIE